MQPLSVVVLAAGLGTRFGGRKQLAGVAPDGAAIFAVLVRRAAEAAFDHAAVVIAPDMAEEVRAHLGALPGLGIDVELVTQERPRGTADAVLAARDAVEGPFAVVNGDDLYPVDGFGALREHLVHGPADEHALVAFRVGRTRAGNRRVMRARIEVDAAARLIGIREGAVLPGAGGMQFEIDGEVHTLDAEALVSMNMWGFRPSIFDALATAVDGFRAAPRDGEVYLPDAVAAEVANGVAVRVLVSEEPCLGVTYAEDLDAVRSTLR